MHSIRGKLTLALLLGFAMLLAAGGTVAHRWMHHALIREFDTNLLRQAQAIMTFAKASDGRITVEFSDRFLREYEDDVATSFFEIWTADGRVVQRSESLGQGHLRFQFGALAAPSVFELTLTNAMPVRAVGVRFTPRAADKKNPIDAVVVAAADFRSVQRTLAQLRAVLLVTGASLLVATVGVVGLVLRRGLAPLQSVAARTARITAESLDTRFPTEKLPTELAPICERLNELFTRLESSFERERRFSADIAHELRTPLAELRSQAEVALKWPGDRDRDRELFQEVLEIALQMEAIVTRLLALARSEQGDIALRPEIISFAGLTASVWSTLKEKATAKGIRAKLSMPDDATVFADRALLRSVVRNLLHNAVDHAPAGGQVQITFARDGHNFAFAVSNTAPGLEPSDLPNLFERFWRKDKARSGTEHAGLGLAISKSFARLLGFDLVATLSEATMLTMTLSGATPVSRPKLASDPLTASPNGSPVASGQS
ncbi:MAG: sensor histidine kinase N-terminal domain-containing protein [Verrucomicrobia bacterium]|nr:sensor histidine kinase N-terminal domain-containing protein [Verrucomicrobiota bacterium]